MLKIFLFFNLFLLELMHPIHISLVNIDWDEENKDIVLLFKLYTDDLRQIIYHYYGIDILALKDTDQKKNIESINAYMDQNFTLENNNKRLRMEFISLDFDDTSTWIKYRIKAPKNVEKINIYNVLLNDLYYNQTNLMIFKYKDFEKGYQLDYTVNSVEIDLKNMKSK